MELKLTLIRQSSGDIGTFGQIQLPSGTSLCTGELPWRGNFPELSCIPTGRYEFSWRHTRKFPKGVYQLQHYGSRSGVDIHIANWMGDISLKDKAGQEFKCDLDGCIALGISIGTPGGQKGLNSSGEALREFEAEMNGAPFNLVITETAECEKQRNATAFRSIQRIGGYRGLRRLAAKRKAELEARRIEQLLKKRRAQLELLRLKNLDGRIEQLEKLDKLLGVKYTGPTSLDWLRMQPNAQTIFGAYEKIALQLEQLQHKLGSISLGVTLNFSAFDKDYLAALKAYQLADVNFKTSSNLSITDGLATLDNNVKQGVNSAGGILDAQATNISKSVSGSAAQTTLAEATRDAATGAEQTAKGQSGAMDSFEAAGILGAAVGAITAAQHVVAAAQGGLVTKPTVALLGEAGQSEAVIPLSNLRTDPKRPQADMEIGTYSSHFPGVTSLAPSSTRKKQTASLQYLVQQQQANRRSGMRNG